MQIKGQPSLHFHHTTFNSTKRWAVVLLLCVLGSNLVLPATAKKKEKDVVANPTTMLQPHIELHGEVSVNAAPDPIKKSIDQLVQTAVSRSDRATELLASEKHYKSKFQRAVQKTKDSLNYIVQFRGLSMSSEAGDVILGEKVKLKSAFSSEYFRQKNSDDLQLQITSDLLEIAMRLGNSDQAAGQEDIDAAVKSLTELVGADAAHQAVDGIKQYTQSNSLPESAFQHKVWSIAQKQNKQKLILQQCLNSDPVVQEIKARIHRYNKRSKLYLSTARVVQTSLGLCSFSPTVLAPASQVLLFCFDMSTGGSEEDKLLRELYLDKRLDSRGLVLNETAHMALEGYQLGLLTHNQPLAAVSKAIIGQLGGPDAEHKVINATVTAAQLEQPPAESHTKAVAQTNSVTK